MEDNSHRTLTDVSVENVAKFLQTVVVVDDKARLSPNPPKDTDGRREDSGRGVRELQARLSGLDSGRREVAGRPAGALGGADGGLRWARGAR